MAVHGHFTNQHTIDRKYSEQNIPTRALAGAAALLRVDRGLAFSRCTGSKGGMNRGINGKKKTEKEEGK